MSGWKRNDHNGIPMRWCGRADGREDCRFCGTRVWWVRYAMRRIPYEQQMPEMGIYGMTDHRSLCRMRREGRYYSVLGDSP